MKIHKFITALNFISCTFFGESLEQTELFNVKRKNNAVYIKELEKEEMFWRTLGYSSITPSKYDTIICEA